MAFPAPTEATVRHLIDEFGNSVDFQGSEDLTDLLGNATDVPADVVEDATARSFVSMLKGVKNYLRALAATVSGGRLLVTTGDITANQGTAGATAWPTKDAGPSWTPIRGVSGEPVTSADMSAAAVAVIDAPDTGEKLVIDDLWLSTAEELSFTLTEETTGTVILGPLYMAANSTQQITPRGKLKLDTADSQLMCQTSAAGTVSVLVLGHSEA